MSKNELKEAYAARNDAVAAEVCENKLVITTRDGRTISTPLSWFPFLEKATPEQRDHFQVLESGIYWDELEDMISMEVILLGRAGT
ncbi:MAG TPA: DUF2442 domain-containing protein [Phototrophicaceae bacterium]|nr:DUF2442 domain-containing protein [Phototrophicaceae bacterium]